MVAGNRERVAKPKTKCKKLNQNAIFVRNHNNTVINAHRHVTPHNPKYWVQYDTVPQMKPYLAIAEDRTVDLREMAPSTVDEYFRMMKIVGKRTGII